MKRVSLDQILADLKDGNPEIKKLAAKALAGDPSCSFDLIASILKGADDSTIAVIYDILYDDEKDFTPVFTAATEADDARIRRKAVRYLFRRGKFSAQDGIRLLKDRDPYVRRRVISYLFWVNDRSALESVIRLAVEDSDMMVRKDALRLIGIWGRIGDARHVVKVLEDSSFEVRLQGIRTMKRLTGEDFGEPEGASDDEFEWIIAKWQGWWELMKERIEHGDTAVYS